MKGIGTKHKWQSSEKNWHKAYWHVQQHPHNQKHSMKLKKEMTKDLAMQGSCIAKVISIHSYPRDLNELEFQE